MGDYTKAYLQLKKIFQTAGDINIAHIPKIDYGTHVDIENHILRFLYNNCKRNRR
jgi:hypothetical protein